MMGYLPQLTHLGKLELIEVYEFYDQPILFSCRNASDAIFIGVFADEDDNFETWLYVGVSPHRFKQIRSGAIDLHDAFSEVEDGIIFQIKVPHNEQIPESMPISATQIPDDMLPLPGEFINLETPTLPELDEDLRRKSLQTRQEIISLALNFDGEYRTEVPANALSEILGSLQDTIDAVGESLTESSNVRGPIPRDVISDMQMSVTRIGAGSFKLELASTQLTDVFGESKCGNAIQELVNLLKVGSNADELGEHLIRLKSRVANRYVSLLESLSSVATETKIVWASPKEGRGDLAYLPAAVARETIDIIEQFKDLSEPEHKVEGTLIGVFTDNKIFGIQAQDGSIYKGKILDEAFNTASTATISERYIATIREVTSIQPVTKETKTDYYLVKLESV
jgi:hypothetical protein